MDVFLYIIKKQTKNMNIKQTLKKTFDSDILAVVGVVFGIGIIFQFIVFPGLTSSDTILNILSLLIGIFSLLFAFHFIQWKKLFDFLSQEEIKPGETELDYIPQEELKTKTKTKKTVVPKQTVKKSKPLIEGKTKSQSKKSTETKKATPPPKPPKVK